MLESRLIARDAGTQFVAAPMATARFAIVTAGLLIAPGLTRGADAPLFAVRSDTPLSAPRDGRDGPTSKTFEVKGVKLHYLVQGTGEPVVLIHGLHSSAQMNWVMPGTMGELAKRYKVIALDLPGHGQSDKPADEQAYGTQMVDDVVALLDHLKIAKAHIVGYSMGGIVTVKMLALHPDRVRSAVAGGMGWLREGSRLQQFWEQIPAREGSRTPPACVRGIAKLAVSEDELRRIKVPVEVVVGSRDPVKRMYVNPLRPVRPDWPVVEIDDAGHLNCIAKSQFRASIADWLSQQSAP